MNPLRRLRASPLVARVRHPFLISWLHGGRPRRRWRRVRDPMRNHTRTFSGRVALKRLQSEGDPWWCGGSPVVTCRGARGSRQCWRCSGQWLWARWPPRRRKLSSGTASSNAGTATRTMSSWWGRADRSGPTRCCSFPTPCSRTRSTPGLRALAAIRTSPAAIPIASRRSSPCRARPATRRKGTTGPSRSTRPTRSRGATPPPAPPATGRTTCSAPTIRAHRTYPLNVAASAAVVTRIRRSSARTSTSPRTRRRAPR